MLVPTPPPAAQRPMTQGPAQECRITCSSSSPPPAPAHQSAVLTPAPGRPHVGRPRLSDVSACPTLLPPLEGLRFWGSLAHRSACVQCSPRLGQRAPFLRTPRGPPWTLLQMTHPRVPTPFPPFISIGLVSVEYTSRLPSLYRLPRPRDFCQPPSPSTAAAPRTKPGTC